VSKKPASTLFGLNTLSGEITIVIHHTTTYGKYLKIVPSPKVIFIPWKRSFLLCFPFHVPAFHDETMERPAKPPEAQWNAPFAGLREGDLILFL
jgi:hypothetical protein